MFVFSPQAIFRDPFRGGDNILVCIIDFDSISNIFLLSHTKGRAIICKGYLWYLHTSWWANSNKQTCPSCWDFQQQEGQWRDSMVCHSPKLSYIDISAYLQFYLLRIWCLYMSKYSLMILGLALNKSTLYFSQT